MSGNINKEIFFKRSKRAKYLRITIKSSSHIVVTIPVGVSSEQAKKFAASKEKWICKQLNKIENRKKQTSQKAKQILIKDIKAAKQFLKNKLNSIAKRFGFQYNRVFIRQQRTRWGSCSAKNNINLNLKILTLPDHLQDYILLHELVHTKQKNHQHGFWEELQKHLPDARVLAKELKNFDLAECKIWFEE